MMKWLNVTSLILTMVLINSACSNTGINSDVKNARNMEDKESRGELGTFSAEDREALTTRRDQVIRIHEENLKIEEERQENIKEEIRIIDRFLERDHEAPVGLEPKSPIEEVNQDEIDKRKELEALDEQALEERLQILTIEFNQLTTFLDSAQALEEKVQILTIEFNQLTTFLDSAQTCQEVVSCQLFLQEIKLVNDVLAEKRNKDFSDSVTHLSDAELTHVRETLEDELETVELEKNRAEEAIETLEQISPHGYQSVRVKLFPNQRGYGHFPDVKGEDSKYAKLHNKGGFKVQEVNVSSNQVLRQLGQAHIVEMFSNCPERPNCSDNRAILDNNEAVILKSGSAISITPLSPISSEGDNYFDLGFTKIEYRGLKRKCEAYCNIPYLGFFRGSFQVRFARQGKTSSDNHWSVINLVSLDEYLLSVTPSELNTNEIEAREAQIIAARNLCFK